MSAPRDATATLIEDSGSAATGEEFFRGPEFLEAEGTTHTLVLERGSNRVAIPLVVRPIEGAAGLVDATSPYSYPGGDVSGEPIDPASIDWSGTRDHGLVSVFVRDRLGEPTALTAATDRSVVLVNDPELPRKSRMSDRQQIRKNDAAGYEVSHLPGPETSDAQRAEFHRVYTETMVTVGAAQRYLFERAYFDLLFASPRSRMFIAAGPEGDTAAAAITVMSDGFLHYYLSGTADAHRKRAPSKNLIVAVTDYADGLGMPMNLGGGVEPGDGLEEFKRGFANSELPFRTHELICDPERYRELSGARSDDGFFPLYRAPG
ncbi:MAG TPA: GNAT family N-acetyltransferase [Solirubrobacterales bacterium]|nr:GNAT family N-acetyltransferase [Solirubrobacterales bacterium]